MIKQVGYNKEGDLRVWHVPQVPGKPFYVNVKSTADAKILIRVLWDYDAFQYKNNIKPDYSNASGLEEFDGNEWVEWYDEYGDTIDEVMS